MGQNNNIATNEQIETIHVNIDDILSAIRANVNHRNNTITHVIRVTPPFDTEVHAHRYSTQQGNFYPPEMNPKPIHIDVDLFHDATVDFPIIWRVERYAMELKGVDDASEISDETIDELRDEHIEVWENDVRSNLKDKVDINGRSVGDAHVVTVKYEEDE